MDKLLITLLVATVGGLLGYNLKLPAGALIGAMVAVGLYNLFFHGARMPLQMQVIVQIVAGAMIGLRINAGTFADLKAIIFPALIMVFSVVIIGFIIGFMLYRFTGMDLTTALFASAPGGLTEMTLAADSMGAEAPKVAMLQLLRLTCVISLMPFIIKTTVGFLEKKP